MWPGFVWPEQGPQEEASIYLFFPHQTGVEVKGFKIYSPRNVSEATFSYLEPQLLLILTEAFPQTLRLPLWYFSLLIIVSQQFITDSFADKVPL